MKIIKGILKVLVILILVIVLSYNVFNFYQMKVLKKDYVDINGYSALEVVSGSMEPTIKIGDMIIINTKVKEFKKGDIVTFYDINNSFVTHRIVEIKDDGEIVTKGDNNDSIDKETILKNKIIGKYQTRIPTLGYIFKSFRNPFVLFMILVIGVLVCIFTSMDKNGDIILTEDEKEYMEFLDYKKNNNIKEKKETKEGKKESSKKKTNKK